MATFIKPEFAMHSITIPTNGLVIDNATVLPEWIDYNGHMNVAYYMQAFEVGIDSYKKLVGLTLHYIESAGRSTVALESHISYQQEAHLGERRSALTCRWLKAPGWIGCRRRRSCIRALACAAVSPSIWQQIAAC